MVRVFRGTPPRPLLYYKDILRPPRALSIELLVMFRQPGFRLSRIFRSLFPFASILLPLFSRPCSAACFTPNGTNINTFNGYPDDSVYAPCNDSSNTASMCCAIGPLRRSPDNCYTDGSGLCYNRNEGPDVVYWRESCTDATWRDPACVKLFVNSTSEYYPIFFGSHKYPLRFLMSLTFTHIFYYGGKLPMLTKIFMIQMTILGETYD